MYSQWSDQTNGRRHPSPVGHVQSRKRSLDVAVHLLPKRPKSPFTNPQAPSEGLPRAAEAPSTPERPTKRRKQDRRTPDVDVSDPDFPEALGHPTRGTSTSDPTLLDGTHWFQNLDKNNISFSPSLSEVAHPSKWTPVERVQRSCPVLVTVKIVPSSSIILLSSVTGIPVHTPKGGSSLFVRALRPADWKDTLYLTKTDVGRVLRVVLSLVRQVPLETITTPELSLLSPSIPIPATHPWFECVSSFASDRDEIELVKWDSTEEILANTLVKSIHESDEDSQRSTVDRKGAGRDRDDLDRGDVRDDTAQQPSGAEDDREGLILLHSGGIIDEPPQSSVPESQLCVASRMSIGTFRTSAACQTPVSPLDDTIATTVTPELRTFPEAISADRKPEQDEGTQLSPKLRSLLANYELENAALHQRIAELQNELATLRNSSSQACTSNSPHRAGEPCTTISCSTSDVSGTLNDGLDGPLFHAAVDPLAIATVTTSELEGSPVGSILAPTQSAASPPVVEPRSTSSPSAAVNLGIITSLEEMATTLELPPNSPIARRFALPHFSECVKKLENVADRSLRRKARKVKQKREGMGLESKSDNGSTSLDSEAV